MSVVEAKSTATYFKIDFDWFTDFVRQQWAEGEYNRAIALMTDSGIPINLAHDVIRGKSKMVQDPDGPEGAAGLVVDDNWQPNIAGCFMGKYPDPLDHEWFKLVYRYGTEGLTTLRREAEWAVNGMNNSTYSLDKIRILDAAKRVPKEIYEYFGLPDPETIHTGDLYEPSFPNLNANDMSWTEAASRLRADRLNTVPGVPDVDTFIKRTLEFDKAPKPKPDKTFSKPLGLINPKGRFYSCEYMQHRDLLDKLHPSYKLEHAQADGWILITHPLGQPRDFKAYYGGRAPTQAQKLTLMDWQQKYPGAEIINGGAGEWGTTDDEDKEI